MRFIPERQDILEFQLEETNLIPGEKTIKKWIVRALNMIPCINLREPGMGHDETTEVKGTDGKFEIIDEATYLDELTKLSKTSDKTVDQLKREEELLHGLFQYKKKQRLYHQFGFRKSLQRQKSFRHLQVDLGDDDDNDNDDSDKDVIST
jgi:hypothetical protein